MNPEYTEILCRGARQITVADTVGPKADEFLFKVQKASAGPPWYMDSPPVV